MPRALFQGRVIAEADEADVVVVEGNVYFPPEALDRACVRPNVRTSVCGWKGTARYYDVVVGGSVADAAAWYYPDPLPAAAQIKDRVAFWRGVTVER